MSLFAQEIGAVLEEMRSQIEGRRIRRIHQLDEHTLLWRTSRPLFCLSCHPRASRIHTVEAMPPRIPAQGFCLQLRRRLEGSQLLALEQPGADRLIRLVFQTQTTTLHLYAELTGRHGNLLLVENGTILGSLLTNRSVKRPLLVGQPYLPLIPRTDAHAPVGSRFGATPGQVSLAICTHYDPLVAAWQLEEQRAAVCRPLKRDLKAKLRLVQNLQQDRNDHQVHLDHQRVGDLILAHLTKIPPRAQSVELLDLFELDALGNAPPITVSLEPRLSPSQNAQAYYRRAGKARRGLAAVEARLPDITADIARLQASLEAIERAPEVTLKQLWESSQAAAAVDAAPGRRPKASIKRQPFRVFEALGGEQIFVGRSAKENHRLTATVARGRDAWLHARDVTGAHVVLRLDQGGEPPHESLLDAACLAKHFSDARREKHADISWTHAKYVSLGRTHGKAYLAQSKTLRISQDDDRLKRLMESRSATARIVAQMTDLSETPTD